MDKNLKKRIKPVKVPVILQLEALECGAAALAMILAYYGKWIPLEEVRRDCGVSRNGSNAKNIVLAARNYGLETSAYRFETETLMERAAFPCIIFWNFNHFVVLNGFKNNKAVINDPARGTVEIPMEEFDTAFTGICLTFRPGEHFVKGGKQKSLLSYIVRRLYPARRAVLFTLLTTLLATLAAVIRPGFTRIFFDRLLTGENPDWVRPFFLCFSGFVLLQISVAFVARKMNSLIDASLTAAGSTSYIWKVLRLPMDFFTQRSVGDIYSRQNLHAGISGTLVNTVAPLVLQAAMLVFYLVVMLRYSVPLSLIGIASVVLSAVIAQYVTKRRTNMIRVQMRSTARLYSTTMAGLGMMETIKANGAEHGFFTQWAGYQAASNAEVVRFRAKNRLFDLLLGLVPIFTTSFVTILGLWFIMSGRFTVGMLGAFQGILASFMSPASDLITAGQSIQQMRASMERLDDVMDYPEDIRDEDLEEKEEEYHQLSGELELRDVSFGYSPLSPPLIKNFSMKLERGKSVALVGSSGCGKSTIAKLISGLYKPWDGEILFDGRPISTISHRVLTGSMAVVDQDITIFADTIANNIRMWDESIEDFAVILAARDAQLHEDIMLREGGYDCLLQEGGSNLSGGQRQRLEIARVLAQDPTIVILDEATSALDARTEAAVVRSITDRGITCIVVAHRLSTVRGCSEIIVLDHGSVVERGTHEELIARRGRYLELVENE